MKWKVQRFYFARMIFNLYHFGIEVMTLDDPRVMTLVRVKKGQNGAKVDPP